MWMASGMALGGLGLFLLAVSMITDGLKLAAGDALRDILTRSTRTRLRGVGSGILVTAVVQSSSAVTVATIGFVNAGLLTLSQALGIVYGSNIGTTMTGWLVAVIGFKLKVDAFALPMIGIGMAARLFGAATRVGALGEALAGFGLFFIGIEVLRDAFEAISGTLEFTRLSSSSGSDLLFYLGFGFLMTLVTQSSSAAIALTLTAATGGVLAINAAAAMVIGANIGTTSTAALAVIGATPNARRVAAAHVTFNLVTGVLALALLPGMLALVRLTSSALHLGDVPAITLALFHTVFNALGVIVMWPLTNPLARFLLRRFRTLAESLAQPVHLDRNVLVTPTLAVAALKLELARMATICRQHADATLAGHSPPKALAQQHDALLSLGEAVEGFVSGLERERLSAQLSARIPNALRVNGYIEEVTTLSRLFAEHASDLARIRREHTVNDIDGFIAAVRRLVRDADPDNSVFSSEALKGDYAALREQWHDLKSILLQAASNDTIPLAHLNVALENLRRALRIAEQSIKIATRMSAFDVPADEQRGAIGETVAPAPADDHVAATPAGAPAQALPPTG